MNYTSKMGRAFAPALFTTLLSFTAPLFAEAGFLETATTPAGFDSRVRQADRDGALESPALAIDDSLLFLSPGDRILVRWWGLGSGSEQLIVNTRWELVVPDRGKVVVRGVPFNLVRARIEELVRLQVKVKLVDFQIISLAPAQINLTGQSVTPGIYEVPAGTRLSKALRIMGLHMSAVIRDQATGLPPRPGDRFRLPSSRKVLLVRGGSGDSNFYDLSRAINAGIEELDPRVFSGDRIVILPQGPVVGVAGSAPYTGFLEMLPGEPFEHFLSITGAQFEKDAEYFAVDATGGRRKLAPGDPLDTSMILLELPYRHYRALVPMVWVAGLVKHPGGYLLKEGMTTRDAVAMAGGALGSEDSTVVLGVKRGWHWLQPGKLAGWEVASQYPEVRQAQAGYKLVNRGNYSRSDAKLQPGDSVVVNQAERVVWIGGRVGAPGFVEWKAGATIEDYVQAAGGYGSRAWKDKVQVFDLYTDQPVERLDLIRPGSAIIVPEKRYLYFDQWLTLGATALGAIVSATYLYLALGSN